MHVHALLTLLVSLTLHCTGSVPLALTPQRFGADGTDTADDTRALQQAVDEAARRGAPVAIPAGTYYVDATARPREGSFGGLVLPAGTHLRFEKGAVLQALPNASPHSSILSIVGVENVVVEGPGLIRGERDTHTGTKGEWGMGILIRDARHVRIAEVTIEACWGDGIYIGRNKRSHSEDIVVTRVRAVRNRRQGISVVSARRVLIENVEMLNTHGTAPSAGIDLEPNDPAFSNEDITIRGGYFAGNVRDILLVNGNRRVVIDGPVLRSRVGISIRHHSEDVLIQHADVYVTDSGSDTAALEVLPRGPSTIRSVRVYDSLLRGGQTVLNVPDADVRGLDIRNTLIVADRPGQRAVNMVPRSVRWENNRVRQAGNR